MEALAALAILTLLAPTSAFGDGPQIRGRVTADGAPLAGAWVELTPLEGRWGLGDLLLQGKTRPEPVRRSVSRDDGTFVVAAPSAATYRLVVGGDGHVPAQLTLIPAYRDLTLPDVDLRPDHGLTLRVADAVGRPVASAAVVAFVRGEAAYENGLPAPTWQRATEVAFTGEDGRVRLSGARGEALQIQVTEPRHPPASLEVSLPAPGELEVRLERGRSLTLRAVDSAGEPVAGVLVWLGPEPFPIGWTGDDGTTGLTLPRRAGLTLGLASEAGHSAAYTISALANLESVRVPLDDPVRRAGRVLRRGSQEPVADAVVWSWYRPDRAVHSDGEGWFRLDGVDPRGRLTAVRDGYRPGHAQVDPDDAGTSAALLLVATARVDGLVVDAAGDPVAGVGVLALGEAAWLPAGESVDWPARTEADGTFLLADLPVESKLRLAVGGRDASGVLWAIHVQDAEPLTPGETRTGVILEARRGVDVEGLVVDESEQPVAGARVSLFGRPSSRTLLGLPRPGGGTGTSDETGRWRAEAMTPGTYDLRVEASGFAPVEVPGLEIESDAVPGSQDLGTVVLLPGVELEGRVVDEDRQGVAGAQVSLQELGGPGADGTVTADDGSFLLRDQRPGAQVSLSASHPDFVHGIAGPLALPTLQPVEIVLEPSATVYGQVRDDGGWPVAEAQVALFGQGGGGSARGDRSVIETDDQGEFVLLGIPAGPATLQVSHKDFPMRSQPVDVLAPSLGPTRVDVGLRRAEGNLHGRVADEAGEPVAAALVLLPGDGIDRPASAHSDAQGAFHVRNVDPGRREVVVYHAAFASFRTEMEVSSDSWLDVELRRGHTVRGVVVDGSGLDGTARPVAGAKILTTPLDAEAGATRQGAESAADGSWILDRLLPGRYLIVPRADGYYVPREAVPVPVDRDLEGVVLEMRRGERLEGQVLGLEFDELPSVRVLASRVRSELGDFPLPRVAEVDYQGRFAFEGLSPGTWSLAVQASSGRWLRKSVEIGDRLPEPVVLEFEDGVDLTGTVRLGRRSVPSVTVMLAAMSPARDGDTEIRDVSGASTRVQHDGRFQFRDLPEGVYGLTVLVPGGVVWHQQVELFGAVDLDIEPPIAGLSGTVRDGAGKPLGDVTLLLRNLVSEGQDGTPEIGSSTSTGDDGRFRIDVLQPGAYEIMLHREGFAEMRQTVELPEGVDTELEMTLLRAEDPTP